jgi:hypothetical protein
MNRNNGKKTTNESNTTNRGKSLLIVNLIFLSKSLDNKTCLIQFYNSIELDIDLVDQFTTNDRFTTSQVNQILSTSLL